MKSAEVLPFNRSNHLLKKAQALLENKDLYFSDPQQGVTCLLDALPYCQPSMMLKILPLLGYAGKDRVLWPLYRLIINPEQNDQVRFSSAVQLATAASQSRDPSAVTALLIDCLDYPQSSVRSSCAIALGWDGNTIAVNHLLHHLTDNDRDVQAAIVTALSAIGGLQVYNQLTDRLRTGTIEEKRSIVLNLWRFMEKMPQVKDVYLNYIDQIEAELKVDLLTGVGMIPLSEKIISVYRSLLSEKDVDVQFQVLKNLSTRTPTDYFELTTGLKELAKNGENRIRQMAIRLLSKR
jgi:HEAT repeat protein